MKARSLLIVLLSVYSVFLPAQHLDITKLDALFHSLEQRNEAMGSITISKNGKVLYSRSLGFRTIKGDIKIPADTETNYRIWSITKLYTATMIMQLIEEGQISLSTTLDSFYPDIPNASIITLEQMLNHTSGIYDFINTTDKEWENNQNTSVTKSSMIQLIAKNRPSADPNQYFNYSNSNYLLLGYIIEQLDNCLYETALENRISSKIGLTSTYFGEGALDDVSNKAYTYNYNGEWKPDYTEGAFSGPIPAGAGGIVSTTRDMVLFINALFTENLISDASLDKMMSGPESYNLGLMKSQYGDNQAFGHTGGYVSESSLFYYPDDNLSIAYCTNGIVIRKEEIIDHVLKIYHHQPFAVSWNRSYQALVIWGLGVLIFFGFKLNTKISTRKGLLLGYIIPIIACLGLLIAGGLHGDYNPIRSGLTELDNFYSISGSWMSGVQLLVAFLCALLLLYLYRSSKARKISIWPITPLMLIIISLGGATLFPLPNPLYTLFANIIILTAIGPLLTIILWRKTTIKPIIIPSLVSLILILGALACFISRPSYPIFVATYFGLIQRVMYIGIGVWIVAISQYLRKTNG